jgi:hypothetical protein
MSWERHRGYVTGMKVSLIETTDSFEVSIDDVGRWIGALSEFGPEILLRIATAG